MRPHALALSQGTRDPKVASKRGRLAHLTEDRLVPGGKLPEGSTHTKKKLTGEQLYLLYPQEKKVNFGQDRISTNRKSKIRGNRLV